MSFETSKIKLCSMFVYSVLFAPPLETTGHSVLTLYYTILSFNDPEKETFGKYWG